MSFKKGITYVFFATSIGLLINLITSFVLPKFLSLEAYANVKLYQLYITYVGILHLGFADGMYLRLGGKKIETIDKKKLADEFKTFKIFQIIVNIIALIVSIILKDNILIAVSFSIIPVNIINYLKNLYQSTGLYNLYSKFTTINNIMLFVVNMILIFAIKTDNSYIYIICNVIVYYINWFLIEYTIEKKILEKHKGKSNIKYFIDDIKDGFPLMIGNFCTVIFTSIDRMFVNYYLGAIEFAFYSFAVSVEGLLNTFITPVAITMYNYMCLNKEDEKIIKIKKVLLTGSSFLISAAFFVKYIVKVYITKYESALSVLFILFATQFFTIIARCIHINLYKAKKQPLKYLCNIASVTIIAIVFDFISYKINGSIEGFAVATFLTGIFWFLMGEHDFKTTRYSYKEYFFIISIVSVYLVTGLLINNVIVGLVIYIIFSIVMNIICLKNEVVFLLVELKKTISNLKKQFKTIHKND